MTFFAAFAWALAAFLMALFEGAFAAAEDSDGEGGDSDADVEGDDVGGEGEGDEEDDVAEGSGDSVSVE